MKRFFRSRHLFTLMLTVFALLFSSAGLLTLAVKPAAAAQYTFYASPTGSGGACTESQPCSLVGARDKVRTVNGSMSGDIIVYLRGGTHRLTSTLELHQDGSTNDSGNNGHNVIYQAYPGETPIVSGGTPITGWTLFDSTKNIYRATVGTSLQTRQLYINGVRAIRARGGDNPGGWSKVSGGYNAPDSSLSTWGNIGDVEVVSYIEWKSFRCGVASASGNSVVMDQPCWNNSQLHGGYEMPTPTWIENAYELLDSEREWYLNRATGHLYYKPSASENMTTATVIAPTVQTLIKGTGTPGSGTPLRNIQFKGLTFSYGTWLRPNTVEGYAVVQSGWSLTGTQPTFQVFALSETPGDLNFSGVKDVRFEGNTFTHLGGVGLNVDLGSQDVTIVSNVFRDISSSGIQIGDTNDADETNEALKNKNVTIQFNDINNIGVEYRDGPGIFAGYVNGLTISRNDIGNVPYSGISVGWGWANPASYAGNNLVDRNYIYDYLQVLRDGGGIYTLSVLPNTTISNNYLVNQTGSNGALYPDDGTQFTTWTNNVVSNAPSWLHLWTSRIKNNTIRFNCSTTVNQTIDNPPSSNNTVSDNLLGLTSWPPECQSVIDGAGIDGILSSVNLALNRPASASSEYESQYSASKANDASISGGWSPSGADSAPWWQVDLGNAFRITSLEVVTRQDIDQDHTRRSFEVRASNDATFATYAVLGAQDANPLPFRATWTQTVINSGGFRYIRVAKTASEYFFISEARVFGVTAPPPAASNIALNKTASASSQWDDGSFSASQGNNGSTINGWSPSGSDTLPWWQVDLASAYVITGVELVARQNIDQAETQRNFELRASNSANFASYTVLATQGSTRFPHAATWSPAINNANAFRYIRVAKTSSEYFFIAELRLFGNAGGTPTATPTAPPVTNVALNKPASASSEYAADYNASKAVDGMTSGWSPTGEDSVPWWQVDLGNTYRITSIELVTRQELDQDTTRRNFEVRASNSADFSTYTVLGTQGSTTLPFAGVWTQPVTNTTRFRYVRATKTIAEYFFIAELRVFGVLQP